MGDKDLSFRMKVPHSAKRGNRMSTKEWLIANDLPTGSKRYIKKNYLRD
jgi:hypothetical protein